MTDLTGADIRVPPMNTGVVPAVAIGFDDGSGRYIPARLSGGVGVPVSPAQGNVATITTLTAGSPLVVDLSNFSGANISISGLSADTLKVETGMDAASLQPATLMKFSAGSPTLQDATAITGLTGNANWSVAGFQGQIRLTRTGSADTLTVKVKGTN